MNLSPEEFENVINARWQMLYKGRWCPVVGMYHGNGKVSNPMQATGATVFTGDPDGAWLATVVSPTEIQAREPGRAPDWLPWHIGARIREAAHGAPQARETLN